MTDLIAADYRKRNEQITELLGNMHTLDEWVNLVLARIPEMSDEQLQLTINAAQEMEKGGFRIRGAATAALQQRIRDRSIGMSRQEKADVGTMADQMGKLAGTLGVDSRTLYTDAKIHETFFAAHAAEAQAQQRVDDFMGTPGKIDDVVNFAQETEVAQETEPVSSAPVPEAMVLDREYYALALTAPDPQAAIELAFTKFGTPGFSTRQFRHDVDALKAAAANQAPPNTEHLEETYIQTVRLPLAMRGQIARQCRAQETDADTLILSLLQKDGLLPAQVWESLQAQLNARYASLTPVELLSALVRKNEDFLVKAGAMNPVLGVPAPVQPSPAEDED
jgi:hypothetical protein